MNAKTNIITEYPYSPIFSETLAQYYYVMYLSQIYNAETNSLLKYRVLPKWMSAPYKSVAGQLYLLYLQTIRRNKNFRFRNIFWFTHTPPLSWKGKLAEKIKASNLGDIIFYFSDDPFIQSKYTKQKFVTKQQQDFLSGLQKILTRSTSIWMHENRLKDYQNRGIEVSDPIVTWGAGDPILFKNTPLPQEKVVALIAAVLSNLKIFRYRNVPLLIDAFRIVAKEHADAKLLFCGPMSPEIKQFLIKETKGLNIEIIGEWIPYFQVHKIYERAYMIVRTRQKIELIDKLLGSSQQAFDASAAARPLVSVGIRKNMPEDFNILVSNYTPEDLAEKICKLLDDRNYAEKIGQHNRRMVEKKHSWELRARKLYEHLEKKR